MAFKLSKSKKLINYFFTIAIVVIAIVFTSGCTSNFNRPEWIDLDGSIITRSASNWISYPTLIKQIGRQTLPRYADASSTDRCTAIAKDSQSNIYCGSYTSGNIGETNAGGTDAFVAKYDASGNLMWVSQIGFETANALSLDATGGERVNSITIDSNDNIFIAGFTDGSLADSNSVGSPDIFIAKLNSDGAFLWVSQIGETAISTFGGDQSGDEYAYDIRVDSGENIYITGYTSGNLVEPIGGGTDAVIAKFDSTGVLQWIRQYGSLSVPGNLGSEICYTLTLHGDKPLCAGATTGDMSEANGGGAQDDIFITKTDDSGAIDFITQIGSVTMSGGEANNVDRCIAIAVDSNNNIFCTGTTYGSLGEANAGSGDIVLVKFNNLGVYQWVKQLGNITVGAAASSNEGCNSMSIDSTNNIYCSGLTNGSLGEASAGASDIVLVKWNNAGTPQFIKQFGNITSSTLASSGDTATGCSVIGTSVYLGGYTNSSITENAQASTDIFIAKYSTEGDFEWLKQLGDISGPGGGTNSVNTDLCKSIKADSQGNIFCTGDTVSNLGEELGSGSGSGMTDAFVIKINSSGSIVWIKQLGVSLGAQSTGSETAESMVLDSNEDVIISGYTTGNLGEANGGGGNADVFIAKLNSSDGSISWISQYGSVTGGAATADFELVRSMTINSSNEIFVCGQTTGALAEPNGGSYDVFIAKYSSSGNLNWIKQLGNVTKPGASSNSDQCHGIALGSNGEIYITGNTYGALGEVNGGGGGSDIFVAKFSSTGDLSWIKQIGNVTAPGSSVGSDIARAITVDINQNIYSVGYTQGSLFDTLNGIKDIFIFKVDTNGNIVWTKQFGQTTEPSMNASDELRSILYSSDGYLYAAGYTGSSYSEPVNGSYDGLLLKMNTDGDIVDSKQLGTSSITQITSTYDIFYSIDIDRYGHLYCAGSTTGSLTEVSGGLEDILIYRTKFE